MPKSEEEIAQEAKAHSKQSLFSKSRQQSQIEGQIATKLSPSRFSRVSSPGSNPAGAFNFSHIDSNSSADEENDNAVAELLQPPNTKKNPPKMYQQRLSTVEIERSLALERLLKSGQLKVGDDSRQSPNSPDKALPIHHLLQPSPTESNSDASPFANASKKIGNYSVSATTSNGSPEFRKSKKQSLKKKNGRQQSNV